MQIGIAADDRLAPAESAQASTAASSGSRSRASSIGAASMVSAISR
jgi:hypothetical protein